MTMIRPGHGEETQGRGVGNEQKGKLTALRE